MKSLLLFTGSYPYSVAAEDTFLPQELEEVGKYFNDITLVPVTVGGTRAELPVGGIDVHTEYADFVSSRKRKALYVLRAPFDPAFIREVFATAMIGALNSAALKRTLYAYATFRLTEHWAKKFLSEMAPHREIVFYTWWFDATTFGLALAGRGRKIPVVTRAHGFDLYETRHRPPYIPFRKQALHAVRAVYPDSQSGAQYLIDRYPALASKIKVAHLGVRDPGFTNAPSTDSIFRILSCSFLLPVKRIDLAIRGIAELGTARSERKFAWTHIGSGPERDALRELARAVLPANVEYRFIDYPGREGLSKYYRTEPIDLFINVSQSEGTPVSVMEAISVGIPVIATAVGGNGEIVDGTNGVLLAPNPQPREISAVISALVSDDARLVRMRKESRNKWRSSYSAQKNYSLFAQTIQEL